MAKYENELRQILEESGLIVVRSAGSMGHGDLVAIIPSGSQAVIIECKATKNKNWYVSRSRENKEQYVAMRDLASRGALCVYAIRRKGIKELHGTPIEDKWEIYMVMGCDPDVPIMRFGEGMSISNYFEGL